MKVADLSWSATLRKLAVLAGTFSLGLAVGAVALSLPSLEGPWLGWPELLGQDASEAALFAFLAANVVAPPFVLWRLWRLSASPFVLPALLGVLALGWVRALGSWYGSVWCYPWNLVPLMLVLWSLALVEVFGRRLQRRHLSTTLWTAAMILFYWWMIVAVAASM